MNRAIPRDSFDFNSSAYNSPDLYLILSEWKISGRDEDRMVSWREIKRDRDCVIVCNSYNTLRHKMREHTYEKIYYFYFSPLERVCHISAYLNGQVIQKCPNYKMWWVRNRWHPPLQPKPLDRIGSNFLWKPLRRILSGASRGFLNFVLEAEILRRSCLFLSPLEGPKTL